MAATLVGVLRTRSDRHMVFTAETVGGGTRDAAPHEGRIVVQTPGRTLDRYVTVAACAVLVACAPTGGPTRSIPGVATVAGAAGPRRDEILREAPGIEGVFANEIPEVWSVLPDVFADLGIQPTLIDVATRQMGNNGFGGSTIEGRRLSNFLDCGRGPWGRSADSFEVQIQMLVDLRPAPGGGTVARTTIDAFAEPRSVSATGVRCRSLGTLEQRVAELIDARLSS